MEGWIKIHRKILDWEWYTETNTFAFFTHLLLICNFKDTNWRGITLAKGETIKSLDSLAEESHLSVQNIRTAISHLKSTGELTERQHGKYRILKIENYTKYQVGNTETNTQLTACQQGSNSRVRIEERKDNKKNILLTEKKSFGEEKTIKLSDDEYTKLRRIVGKRADDYIQRVENWKLSKGTQYKNDYRGILQWIEKDKRGGALDVKWSDFKEADFLTQEDYKKTITPYV